MFCFALLVAASLGAVLARPSTFDVSGRASATHTLAIRDIPEPIKLSTAKEYLANCTYPMFFGLDLITLEEESNSPEYERDKFHTWIIVNGRCDTREYVLTRDGTNVENDDSDCDVTSGEWTSPYDGLNTTKPSDLDIDHVVPLKEAWLSGARDWDDDQREQFANDITRPQLVAVTDNLNQAKSDQDVADWVPPLESYVCKYIRAWIQVKHYYDLSIDEEEKHALEQHLDAC